MGAEGTAIKGAAAQVEARRRIRDLGVLEGEVLLFGGPCSNLQASRALLAEARARAIPPERRICTGDVIAYCAAPGETLQLWQREARIVAGNCERQLAAGAAGCGCGFAPGSRCDRLSQGWYRHALGTVSAAQRAFMASLPDVILFSAFGRRHAVIHGGLSDIARFLWPVSPEAAFAEEIALLVDLVGPLERVIAGHCGIAFRRRIGAVEWLNAGSIGLPPNDGRPETRYLRLTGAGAVFERLRYDAAAARADMERAGLVQGYERALVSGWWPSEEILPPQMRRAQPSRASG